MNGYYSTEYAKSLAGYGEPRKLEGSGVHIIVRPVAASSYTDAMGLYPLMVCDDWGALERDLRSEGSSLVSLTAVVDPLGSSSPELLRSCFPDLVNPFKTHYVIEANRYRKEKIREHHRRALKKAHRELTVERVEQPARLLDSWVSLYSVLIQKHSIHGIPAFSREAFAQQLAVPGIEVFKAERDGGIVGMTLWYRNGNDAYYHLGASSELGYTFGAQFAIFDTAIDELLDRGVARINLGGGAGVKEETEKGLGWFKQGWATTEMTAYLCGRVLNRDAYNSLSARVPAANPAYFPLYRCGEFS